MYWKIRKQWKQHSKHFWGDQLDVRYYLCEQISKLKNKKILDVGCSIGIISGCVDGTNNVVGVDTEEKAIAIAKQLYPQNDYLVEDLWKYKGKEHDVVIIANMMEMFPQEKRRRLLEKIASFLKRGGSLYMTTPNEKNSYYRRHSNKLSLQELAGYLKPCFAVSEVTLWNPISIHLGHLAVFPGAYTLMKWLSKIFRSKQSVSIYIKARKIT